MFQVFNLPGMFDLCVKFGIFRLKAFDCVLKTFSILFCCKPLPTVVILIQNERSKFCTHKIRKIYIKFGCSLGLPASIFLKMKLYNALNVNPHELNIYRGHKYVGKLFLKCKINPSWVYYTEKKNHEFIIQKKVQICMAECILIKGFMLSCSVVKT